MLHKSCLKVVFHTTLKIIEQVIATMNFSRASNITFNQLQEEKTIQIDDIFSL